MTTATIRERLFDYIRTADDKKIKAMYTLLEEQLTPVIAWHEDKEFVADLNERVRRWEEGIDQAQTWDELEQSIAELKSKRAAK